MSNVNKLREAIVNALSTDGKTLFNKDEFVGIVAHTNKELHKEPEKYLTIGNLSSESWPFNAQAETIEIVNIKSSPVIIVVGEVIKTSTLHLSAVGELWSVNDQFKPLKQLYKRGSTNDF